MTRDRNPAVSRTSGPPVSREQIDDRNDQQEHQQQRRHGRAGSEVPDREGVVVDVQGDQVAWVGWPSPKRMNGIVKSLKVHRNRTSTSTLLTGRISGRVTCRPGPDPCAVERRRLVEVVLDGLQARP